MIRLKRTSDTNKIEVGAKFTPQCLLGIIIAKSVYDKFGVEMVITSIADGKHKVNSKHYEGNAFDVRTNNIPTPERQLVFDALKDALQDDYDVVYHSSHTHIEYDPD